MTEPSTLGRVRGGLLGVAVGDALGAPIEFQGISEIRASHGEAGITDYVSVYGRHGAITDDTQMTLFTGLVSLGQISWLSAPFPSPAP